MTSKIYFLNKNLLSKYLYFKKLASTIIHLLFKNFRFNMMKSKALEWFGVITAIIYSMMVALNIGVEFVGFLLLLISAISIGYWAYLGKHRGILFLQFFYATAGVIGMVRWY